MSCTFASSAEWEKRVTAGAYHSKLISVQVPVLVDVTEVPDLQGKRAARLSGGGGGTKGYCWEEGPVWQHACPPELRF